jgi:hypothetical protein
LKHITWLSFTLSETDWDRVKEACEILAVRELLVFIATQLNLMIQDSNRIQQSFSAEKRPTLWRVLPAIEELQTAWEAKRGNPRFAVYKTAIDDGLAKLNKYYSRFDEKPAYVLALGMLILITSI